MSNEYNSEVNEAKLSPCCCCGGNGLATDFEGLKLDMEVVESKLTNDVNSNSRDIEKLSAEFTRVLRQVDKVDQQVNYLTNAKAESDCNSAEIIYNLTKENKKLSESVKILKLEVENYKKVSEHEENSVESLKNVISSSASDQSIEKSSTAKNKEKYPMGLDNDVEIRESDFIITQKQSSSSAYLNSEAFENQTSKNTKMSTSKDNILVNETVDSLPPSQITNPVPARGI